MRDGAGLELKPGDIVIDPRGIFKILPTVYDSLFIKAVKLTFKLRETRVSTAVQVSECFKLTDDIPINIVDARFLYGELWQQYKAANFKKEIKERKDRMVRLAN